MFNFRSRKRALTVTHETKMWMFLCRLKRLDDGIPLISCHALREARVTMGSAVNIFGKRRSIARTNTTKFRQKRDDY